MKIKEYNPLKRSIVAVIATMALFSCSDWTETESLNLSSSYKCNFLVQD